MSAQQTGLWGDQGDSTYRNPILPADYSDPDVIRVGKDYYMIASTFQLAPGVVILHSNDLVNWETISYAVDSLHHIGPNLNWDAMKRYNRGIYAGSIRYHNDSFYIHFTTIDEGIFVCKSKKITGPWTTQFLKDKNGKPITAHWWDDPCPFWDDDGKAYFVASKLPGGWAPRLFSMSVDGTQLLDAVNDSMNIGHNCTFGDGTIYCHNKTSEGNKLYKINGYYYLYHNEVTQPENYRIAVMHRSKYLFGVKDDGTPGKPGDVGKYEEKKMLRNAVKTDLEPNQGGLVATPNGKWYFITQQGKGSAWGRAANLLPVQWIKGWPIPGIPDKDTIGTINWVGKKPIMGYEMKIPQGSDEFNEPTLNPRWQWNYESRYSKWSLKERSGFLRLKAFKPLFVDSFFTVGNVLAQRYFKCDSVEAITKIDINNMADSQEVGLAHFNGGVNYSNIAIIQKDGAKQLKYVCDSKVELGNTLPDNTRTIWLKAVIDRNLINHFEYSLDGIHFTSFGGKYLLKWGKYRGDYIGIYTYNNAGEKGYVDIDWFHYLFDHYNYNSK